jgi:hypothetical protein
MEFPLMRGYCDSFPFTDRYRMGILLTSGLSVGSLGGCVFMRLRSILLTCVVGLGASAVVADAASAIELGPVSLPPTVTVTVPPNVAVGPVVVETPKVLPTLLPTASVGTSPANGVGVDVSLPPVLGPVLPGLPSSVHVSVGPDGVAIAAPDSGSISSSATKVAPRASTARGASFVPAVVATEPTSGGASVPAARDHNGAVVPAPSEDTTGAVNASLRVPQPSAGWNLWRAAASARGLWVALLLIVLVSSWITRGLLRDAIVRARVKPV